VLEWVEPLVTIGGSVLGSFIGVRVAVARLEVQVGHIDGMIRAHDTAIDGLTNRIGVVEVNLDRMQTDIGTHDTGLRGAVHTHYSLLTSHELRLHAIDDQPIRVP
jgi:hypothetical protein